MTVLQTPHRQRIALIRFSSLGDLVTMEPRLRALRAFHPEGVFTFITSAIGRELYGDRFDACIVAPDPKASKWQQARDLLAALPDRRFDYVYDLQGGTVSLLAALGLRAGRRVYQSTRPWQKLLGLKAKGIDTRTLLAAAGFPLERIDAYFAGALANTIQLEANPAQVEAYRELFARAGSRPQRAVLAMGASENWTTKHWGLERYGELAARLAAEGFSLVLVGTDEEKAMAAAVSARVHGAIDLIGRTSIGQLKAVLDLAAVFIGNDSGPAHIAAGMGTPTVTIFGPTSPVHCVKHFPYRGTHACLAPEDLPCHPCYQKDCGQHHRCMEMIPVAEVFRQAMAIARPAAGAPNAAPQPNQAAAP